MVDIFLIFLAIRWHKSDY